MKVGLSHPRSATSTGTSELFTGAAGRRLTQGLCHRCGWRCTVRCIGRSERRRFGLTREFQRLCEACMCDVVQTDTTTPEDNASA